jgi:hypothetical protein
MLDKTLLLVLLLCLALYSRLGAGAIVALSQLEPLDSVNATMEMFERDASYAQDANASFLVFGEFSLFQPRTRNQTAALCSREAVAAIIARTQGLVSAAFVLPILTFTQLLLPKIICRLQ